MAGTQYDVIIGGTKAKILHGDQAGYRRRSVRQQVEQQLVSQAATSVLSSRLDRIKLYQTSWSGGTRWWKPLLNPNQVDSYFQSNNMDTWSEPGSIVPGNKWASSTAVTIFSPLSKGENGSIYAIGTTTVVDGTQQDVFKWTPASNAFVQETGYSSGVPSNRPLAIVFDPNDNFHYVLVNGGGIDRFDPLGTQEDKDWISSAFTTFFGSNVFITPNQGVMFYNGDEIWTLDKSGPSVTSVFDDGLGPDFLNANLDEDTNPAVWRDNLRLAVSTPEGIYYVKNVASSKGNIVPWVFRIDKDATGSWIGEPIATLPEGDTALNIIYHMGSIIIATTPNIAANTTTGSPTWFESILYSVDANTGLSVLGSILGRGQLDEAPFALLSSSGPILYIGGHKRIWAYDAARGGIHILGEHGVTLDSGPVHHLTAAIDSGDDPILLMTAGIDSVSTTDVIRIKLAREDDPDTVTNFGDDETHYTLESNYFDGSLPMELKELTKVEILRDAGNGSQEWTVQVSADDGAFADVLVHSTTGETYATATLNGTTGRRFRYKLIYQTKNTTRTPLRALMFTMSTGELITEWDLMLDGAELLNVDNELQDEQAFFDSMVTLSANESIITFIDNMQEQEQLTSDGDSGTKVTVQVIEIIKDKAGESAIRLVLRAVV